MYDFKIKELSKTEYVVLVSNNIFAIRIVFDQL